MIGNVKFIWTEYKCTACGKQSTVNEVYQAEKIAAKDVQSK
jgi:DNA-directed RNA polymerase subunit RPC12/RpoP